MPQTGFGQAPYQASFSSVTGRPAGVIAGHGNFARYKAGGLTIDWTTIAPVLATFTETQTGTQILPGQKYLHFGTVVCKQANGKYAPFSAAPGAPTTLNGAVIVGQTVVPVVAGAGFNPGDSVLIAAGGGTAETLIVQSVAGNVLTFQTGAAFTHTTGTAVTAANDAGRVTLRRGECFIIDKTIILGQDLGSDFASNAFDGGCTVYLERVASDFGTQGPPTNPTRAQLEAGFPSLDWLIN